LFWVTAEAARWYFLVSFPIYSLDTLVKIGYRHTDNHPGEGRLVISPEKGISRKKPRKPKIGLIEASQTRKRREKGVGRIKPLECGL